MFSLLKKWYQRHFSQPGTVEFALVLVTCFILVYYFMWLVGPLVVALCIAYCLDWGVRSLMQGFKWSRSRAASVVMILFIGVCVGLVLLVLPRVIRQGADFYQNLVSQSQFSAEQVEQKRVGNELSISDLDNTIALRLYDAVENLPDVISSMISFEQVQEAVVKTHQALVSNMVNIVQNQIMPSVYNIFSFLMYLIIVPIFTYLMLLDKKILQKRIQTYILPNNQEVINVFWPKINSQIEGYIRAKLLHIIVISIVNTTAFLFFGLNYSILLGIGVGLSVVIPYVGAVLIGIPVLLISVMQFGFSQALIWLWVVYIVIQLLDSNLLTPKLFSKAMNLDAFSILAAILIFGGLWGFWGVFFSIPLATFISTIIVHWPNADVPAPPISVEQD